MTSHWHRPVWARNAVETIEASGNATSNMTAADQAKILKMSSGDIAHEQLWDQLSEEDMCTRWRGVFCTGATPLSLPLPYKIHCLFYAMMQMPLYLSTMMMVVHFPVPLCFILTAKSPRVSDAEDGLLRGILVEDETGMSGQRLPPEWGNLTTLRFM